METLYLYRRELGDGRGVAVIPLTFGRARITIGPAQGQCYDDGF